MTLKELRAEAKTHGYRLIPIQRPVKMLPCKCGYKSRARYYSAGGFVTVKCNNCGFSVTGRTEANARLNWNKAINKMIQEGGKNDE